MGDDRARLDEMVDYYRARADEYDEWFERRGRYDRGEALRSKWNHDVAHVEEWLRSLRVGGDVLELAGGTGWWTERIAATADTLAVVDASPETLELNRRRVGRDDVRYLVHDLFDWTPGHTFDPTLDRAFDVVFFSFWMSHVPAARFDRFWEMVGAVLRPGGRAVFVDSLPSASSGSTGAVPATDDDLTIRSLNDGREFTIVKVFYEPDDLGARLHRLGWSADIGRTDDYFLYGSAVAA